MLCFWDLLSSGGQQANIQTIHAMETQRRDSCLYELRKVTFPLCASASSSVNQGDKWDDFGGPLCHENLSSASLWLYSPPPLSQLWGEILSLTLLDDDSLLWPDSLSFVSHGPMSTPYLEHKRSPAVFGIIEGKQVSTIINSTVCKVVPDGIILTSCLNGRRDYLQMEANPLQGDCWTFSQ